MPQFLRLGRGATDDLSFSADLGPNESVNSRILQAEVETIGSSLITTPSGKGKVGDLRVTHLCRNRAALVIPGPRKGEGAETSAGCIVGLWRIASREGAVRRL